MNLSGSTIRLRFPSIDRDPDFVPLDDLFLDPLHFRDGISNLISGADGKHLAIVVNREDRFFLGAQGGGAKRIIAATRRLDRAGNWNLVRFILSRGRSRNGDFSIPISICHVLFVRRLFFLNSPDFLQPLPDARFESLIGRLVIVRPARLSGRQVMSVTFSSASCAY